MDGIKEKMLDLPKKMLTDVEKLIQETIRKSLIRQQELSHGREKSVFLEAIPEDWPLEVAEETEALVVGCCIE